MAQATSIEWTDLTWNPVHGCSKVSPGCAHCYAETLSLRYGQTTLAWTPANAATNVQLKPHKLREPLSGAKAWQGLGAAAAAAGKTDGKLVFVNSTSDLFHERVPDRFIAEVFAVMAVAQRHTFQVLTKRPERMLHLLGSDPLFPGRVALAISDLPHGPFVPWTLPLPNVWLGVSIENRRFVGRADVLRQVPAAARFISAEPLLGSLDESTHGPGLRLRGIDWLIVGGESGPRHRPIKAEWVRDLRDACSATVCPRCVGSRLACDDWSSPPCGGCGGTGERGTAFFFKQWGGRTSKAGGRVLDGREWSEFPAAARVAA